MWKVLVAICIFGQPCTLFEEDPIKYYQTEKECIEHMGYANENLQKSDQFQDNAKAVCLSHKPDLFTPAPKF